MDAFITPEARREFEALTVFRPKPGAWGVLVGHRRGPRFVVEKALLAGDGRAAPDERLLAGLEDVWPGRTIGLFAFRPAPAFLKAVLGPAWYGKLFFRLSGPARRPAIRPSVVEIERGFFLDPIGLAPEGKEKSRE